MSEELVPSTDAELSQSESAKRVDSEDADGHHRGPAMMVAPTPLGDVSNESSSSGGGGGGDDSTSGQKDLLASALATLVEHEQAAGELVQDGVQTQPTAQITDLDATQNGYGLDQYTPLTPPNSQLMFYPATNDTSLEYPDQGAYYTSSGHYYQPLNANAASAWYPAYTAADGTIHWQEDNSASVPYGLDGDYGQQHHQYNGYEWLDGNGGIAIKEEPYDEASLVQAAANFESSYQQQVDVKKEDDDGQDGGQGQAIDGEEEKYASQEPNQQQNMNFMHMQQQQLSSQPPDEKILSELAAKYTHQRFPIKLWNLATDPEFVPINWSLDGTSLIIDEYQLDPALRYFFRSHKFSSFLRQLHLYGFRKMTRMRSHKGDQERLRTDFISEYGAKDFVRGRSDLVKKVRRFYGIPPNSEKCLPETPPSTPLPFLASSPASFVQHSMDSYQSSTSPMYTIPSQKQLQQQQQYMLFNNDPTLGGPHTSLGHPFGGNYTLTDGLHQPEDEEESSEQVQWRSK